MVSSANVENVVNPPRGQTIAIAASIGFTVSSSLLLCDRCVSEGSALSQTRMGALLSFLAAQLALGISRITRGRAS
jgi:hypothetical protein